MGILDAPLVEKRTVTKTVAPTGIKADYNTTGTNDHTVIASALTAINALGGGELLFREGQYNVSAVITLYSNITLRGMGQGKTIIKSSGTWSGDFFNIGSNLGTSSGANPAGTFTNIRFVDLEFDGNGGSHSAGAFYGVTGLKIESCYMHNGSNYGFYIANGTNVWVHNNTIKDLIGTGTQAGIQFKGVVNGWVVNNYVYNNHGGAGLQGIDSHATDGVNGRNGDNNHTIGNTIELCGQGINNEDTNAEIIGNTIKNVQGDYGIGIRGTVDNTIISSNIIEGSAGITNQAGITTFYATLIKNIVISGNTIRGLNGTTSDGVFLANATNATFTGNIIANNGRYGFYNRVTSVMFDNNRFYDDQATPTQTQGLFNDTTGSVVGTEIAQIPSTGAGPLVSIKGQDATPATTNQSGGSIQFKTGIGTGNAATSIAFFTATDGASGTTTQSLVEKMRLASSSNGRLWLGLNPFAGGTTTGYSITDGFLMAGNVPRVLGSARPTGSVTSGGALTVTGAGASVGSTNLNGGNAILSSGISTGTGSSSVIIQTPTPGTTGTADNSPATRMTVSSAGIDVASNKITSLATPTVATDAATKGYVDGKSSSFNVVDYGAKGDLRSVTDGAMTSSSATLTSATAAFTSADVGKRVTVTGAYTAGANLYTTVSAYVSNTSVTLALAAQTTVTGAIVRVVTNEATAINAAITAAAVNGGTVVIPGGTWYLYSSIKVKTNVILRGVGWGTKLVYGDGCTYNDLIANDDPTNGNSNMTVRDLQIDGNAANCPHMSTGQNMVRFFNCTDYTWENLYVHDTPHGALVPESNNDAVGFTGPPQNCRIMNNTIDTTVDIGIYMSKTDGAIVTGNIIRNTGSYGIRMSYAGGNNQNIISNNRLYNCGVTLIAASIISEQSAANNQINGNYIYNSGSDGIYLSNTAYHMVNNNYIYMCRKRGINWLNASRGDIVGNVIILASQEGNNVYSGISLDSCSEANVVGNRSGGTATFRQKYGIEELNASDNNNIQSNMVQRNVTGGVLVVGANTTYGGNLE